MSGLRKSPECDQRRGILCPHQPMPLRVSSSDCSPPQSSPRPPEAEQRASYCRGAIVSRCGHD
jgi:hypothetical protein